MLNSNKITVLSLSFLIYSCHSWCVDNLNETDLKEVINKYQIAPIAKSFSIQQATNKARIQSVNISPDGKHVAYVTRVKKGVTLNLLNLNTNKSKKLFDSYILKRIDWSTDGQILFLQSADYIAYLNPFEETPNPQIFYRFNKENEEDYYGLDNFQQKVIISRKVFSKKESRPYHLVSIDTHGKELIIYKDKVKVYDYLFDNSGNLRFIRQPNVKLEKHIIYQLNGQDKTPVFSCIVIDKCRMIKFDEPSQKLFIIGFGEYDFRSYFSVDILNQSTELIHQDPDQLADLLNLIVDEKSGEILQLDYHFNRVKHYGLSDIQNMHFKRIENQLDGNLKINSSKNSENWLIIQSNSQLHHNKYYIYNTNSQNINPILDEDRSLGHPLSSDQLVSSLPLTYKASDGMYLHGYLMLPKGRPLNEVPLLTYVHGGPFNRNRGGYSPIQFLVNQGYAIFKPNFRASTGYGLKYMLAGKEQFSTRVQEDILNGIDFILDQGIGDKTNMGIFGHSFGGYSVLALMSQYPEVFQAGVATAPGTNLLDLLKKMDNKRINDYDGLPLKNALTILFADLNNDIAIKKMETTSPVNTWSGINKPLLIWGGRLDQRIPITHLRDYALKLKQSGKSIEFIEDKKVGHNPPKNDELTPQAMLYIISEFFNRKILNYSISPNKDIEMYLDRYRVY